MHKGEATAAELSDSDSLNPSRPIYVELDRKKKKMVDPSKIKFYLGSLSIEKLGRIVPSLSDSGDAIVPNDFQCVRLYWSTQEPWKIVKYSIKTSIQTANGCGFDNGKNFTVDHSKDQSTVQSNITEIQKWHMSLNQDDDLGEEVNDEEPQNNADLLPPEIKDAIFEDLPHDMLNSISMFDIFSPHDKLMTEEYPLTVNDVEQLKDSIYNDSNDSFRFDEFTNGSSSSLDFLESIRSHELKRTKSELLRNPKTCNINWNITTKKRKINHKLQEIILPINKKKDEESMFNRLKISQLDGAFDFSPKRKKSKRRQLGQLKFSKLKHSSIKIEFKISQLDGIDDQVMTQMMPQMENPVTCDRCRCTYRTQESYERHLAGCDAVSTSDSEPESPRSEQSPAQANDIQTYSLNFNATSTNGTFQTAGFPVGALTATSTALSIDPQTNAITVGANYLNRTTTPSLMQNGNIMSLQPNSICQTNMGNVILTQQGLGQNSQIFTPVQMNGFQQQLLPFQTLNQLGANMISTSLGPAITTQQMRPEYDTSKTQQLVQQAIVQNNLTSQGNKILMPANRKQVLPRLAAGNGQLKNKTTTLKPALKKEQTGAIQLINSLPMVQASPQNAQNVLFQQAAQPLMLQTTNNGLSNNLVQYITDNQNLMQYVALPQTTDMKTQATAPQYLTTTPNTAFLQGAFQMPAATEQNILVANGSGGFSMIPLSAIQPAQPQILGTLVQPQATTIQMGVMSSEHMVMGSQPALEMVQDPSSGLMYLASQPVYYGLETIVQNTVMSSQQFVSTAMQSVCQNASFSATTTQVFQTSKIEPIVEVPPGYVVLNNDNTQSIMPAQTPQIQQAQYLQSIAPAQAPQAIQAAPTPAPTYKVEEIVSSKVEMNHNDESPKMKQITSQIQQQKPILVNAKSKSLHQVQIQKAKPMRPIVTTTTTTTTKVNNISCVKPKIIAKPVIKPAEPIQTITTSNMSEIKIITPESCMVDENQAMNFGKLNMNVETNPPVFISPICDNTTTTIATIDSNNSPYDNNTFHDQQTAVLRTSTATTDNTSYFVTPSSQSLYHSHASNNPSTIILPTTVASGSHLIQGIPTNIVSPIQQNPPACLGSTTNRPTNRVLPMQTFIEKSPEHKIESSHEEAMCDINDLVKENSNKMQESEFNCQLENEFSSSKMMENVDKVSETINKLVSAIDEDIFMDMQTSENKKQQIVEEVCNTIQNEILSSTMEKRDISSPMLEQVPQKIPDAFDLLRAQQDEIHPIPIRLQHQNTQQQSQQEQQQQQQQQHEEELACLERQEVSMQVEQIQLSTPQPDIILPNDVENMVIERKEMSSVYQKENIEPENSNSINARSIMIQMKSESSGQPLKLKQPQATVKSTSPKILFEIQSQDGFTYKSTSISEVWEKVFESVQVARKAHGLKALPDGPLSEIGGMNMLGLKTNAIRYLLEQLPGAEKCTKYTFKYHKNRVADPDLNVTTCEFEDVKENKHEVARFIPYSVRSEYDMFSWLASRHRKQPTPVVIQNNDEITVPR